MFMCFFFLMIRRPPRSTLDRSSAASDVYKRQFAVMGVSVKAPDDQVGVVRVGVVNVWVLKAPPLLSLIHISEPTRPY